MRRIIRTLFNFDPPADDEELRAAARQFVRKFSGFAQSSRADRARSRRRSPRSPMRRAG
jgi:hypothetical protein